MWVSGAKTRPMGKASTSITMGPYMRASGKTTSSMGTAWRYGRTRHVTKETTSTEPNTAKALFAGLTGLATSVSFALMTFAGGVSTSGATDAATTVTGTLTKCMVTASSGGKMVESMKASLLMTGRKARGRSPGPTSECMSAHGRMASSMGPASSLTQMVGSGKATGWRARCSGGSTRTANVARRTPRRTN